MSPRLPRWVGSTGVPTRHLQLPRSEVAPVVAIGRRLGMALAMLAALVALVLMDRGGYTDSSDGVVSPLDAVYYATVSLSTTGYGDVTPVSPSARLVNVLLVTPLRIGFLIILVGTTLEVLTERSRLAWAQRRWRSRVNSHVVVCGYGTKGRSAVRALLEAGVDPADVVVVDPDEDTVAEATAAGLTAVHGNATRSHVLSVARVQEAATVVVAPKLDEQAVLITLTARELAPHATIVAAVREGENAHLLVQSGADSVITSSDAAGRLLGLATHSPLLVRLVEDLLVPGSGLDLRQRPVTDQEIGQPVSSVPGVLAVARGEELLLARGTEAGLVRAGDQVVELVQA